MKKGRRKSSRKALEKVRVKIRLGTATVKIEEGKAGKVMGNEKKGWLGIGSWWRPSPKTEEKKEKTNRTS